MNCVEKYKEEVCNVRNIEMNYYNVYYYCNIIDNLLNLFTSSIDWVVTGAQFTELFFEEEIECFPKYSALHAFCDFAIRQLLFEEAEEQIEDIQDRYDNSVIDNKAKRLSVAFRGGEKDDCFLEVDRLFKTYGKKHESFFAYLVNNGFDSIIDAYDDFTRFDGDLDDVILHLSRELFFILFQNREFLFRFNTYMANANPKKSNRCNIPQWVKRAVKYRDRGRCVCCGKDLSGLIDCEDEASVHYDHMVSLNSGGMNDISNIQLLCSDCNLKKSSDSYTEITYKDWYDFDEM